MTDASPLLVMEQVSKSYDGVQALRTADLAVLPGEVHALLGENGAGKSTLMKILVGAVQADSGTITHRRRDRRHPLATGRPAARARHRLPAPGAGRRAEHRRQRHPRPRARPRRLHRPPGGSRPDPRGAPAAGNDTRARAVRRRASSRRAAARRGRASDRLRPACARARRADRLARPPGGRGSFPRHPRASRRAASRSSTSRTASRRCSSWPTGSRCCGTAPWSARSMSTVRPARTSSA